MPPKETLQERTEAQIARIRTEVALFLIQHWSEANIPENFITYKETADHIINIGTSILCTKWGVGPEGGGFVKAIVNNDLMATFNRADNINRRCIEFYCFLLYNMPYVD
jgi:hypothetical protein